MQLGDLLFLNTADAGFSTRSAEVIAARAAHWAARTPYGLAVLRYRQVGQILRDRRFRQGSHNWPETNGLTGPFAQFWARSVIGQEGEDHRRLRNLIVPALSEDFVQSMVPAFDKIAHDLCANLVHKTTCEFQSEFAIPFAGQAITTLLGLPRSDWETVSKDASDLGLAMGVECARHEAVFDAAYMRLRDLAADLVTRVRRGHDRTSLIARLVDRFDTFAGSSEEELSDLIVIAIFGGVDTTRSQLGLGMALFCDHPQQWQALRQDRALVPNAVEEMIRARPTTTWVTRETTEAVTLDGLDIPKGTVLHLMVHASARDPLIEPLPAFDIMAKRKRHFGFGGGAHHCIGHSMARSDMAAALRALRRVIGTVDAEQGAVWLPDSGNTSAERLPLRYTVDQIPI